MLNIVSKIIDFILPNRCLSCGKVINNNSALCEECFSKITFITEPYCVCCGMPVAKTISDGDKYCITCLEEKKRKFVRHARACVVYDEFSKKLILDFKFFDHIENKKLLVNWLNIAGHDIFEKGIDLIVPVPLHYTRMLKRKYNQSAILANELAKLKGFEVNLKCLKKRKITLPQVKCSGKERRKNVKGSFCVTNYEAIKGKRIVLIDDVYTTGATLLECAKVLKKAGAKSVDALTIARVTL